MKLLLVAADAMEFPGILSHAREVRPARVAVDWARQAKLGDDDVLLVANGAGEKRAAAAVDSALASFDADAVVSTGFCGALDPEMHIADIVVANEILVANEIIVANQILIANQIQASRRRFPVLSPNAGSPHHMGVVCSIDHVAQTSAEKRILRGQGASAVEMEAGGVAERAQAHGKGFYCVRVVTDLAGEDMANDFNQALRPDGHFATMNILSRTLRDPLVRLPELLRLRNRCVRAARVLGDFIADCRF
ncbi:MAG: putative phosphorylase, family 1 [Candidatus Solibacter sp.]|nr:putative phosphorylase, family 1 [Candidatus Solibacter sp.]